MRQNPTSWHFARPELAEHHLQAFDLGLISATALHARRRMGKTEFLIKDLTPAAEARGYVVGYCNLWQEDRDPADSIAEAIAGCAAPRSKNTRLLLIDEAQILGDARHRSLEKALRALLDTRKGHLKVIFTGSSEDRLRTMFGAEDKAFYNWARVEPMPLLGEEFVRELTRRANMLTTMKLRLDDTLRAFDALKRVPELFRRFLAQYLANAFEGVDRAIEMCKQSVYAQDRFAARWEKMLPADRVVLQWIAAGEADFYSAKSLTRMGQILALGGTADRSVPQNALKRLRDRQILIRSDIGVYRFEDETFHDWVKTVRSGR